MAQLAMFSPTIYSAVYLGELEEVKRLVAEDPRCVNRINEEGYGALHMACSRGHAKVVAYLLDEGANPYLRTRPPYHSYSRTPLEIACEEGEADVVEALLQKGADPCALLSASYLNTLLKVACEAKKVEVVRCLLRNERVRMRTIDDYHCNFDTALDIAACDRNAELVELLLGAGADPYAGFIAKHQVISASKFDPRIESITLFKVGFYIRYDIYQCGSYVSFLAQC